MLNDNFQKVPGLDPLSPEAFALIQSKRDEIYQIVCGALLLFFKDHNRFPEYSDKSVLVQNINDISHILNTIHEQEHYITQICLDNGHRTIKQYKQEIRLLFGVRISILKDRNAFMDYCLGVIFPMAPKGI